MANLKFLKGNYASLGNAAITEGQILVTKDTRELFVDVDASTRIKIGDFTVIANLAALEALDATSVPTSRLYYVEDGNILARSNGTTWIQVNKQKTADELKTMLGLGSMAYVSEVTEDNLSAELAEKVNASAEGNHSHDNKELLDTYTQTEADLKDAVDKKHEHANKDVIDGITAEKVSAWDSAEGNAKSYADGLATGIKNDIIGEIADGKTVVDIVGEAVYDDTQVKADIKANTDAIDAIKNGESISDFAGVEAEFDKVVYAEENKSLVADSEIARLAAMSDGANKVEESDTNGNIKIDGEEVVVYTHPTSHTVDEISDFAEKVEAYDYATKAEAQGYADAKDEAIATAKQAGDDAAAALATHITEAEGKYETKTDASAKLTEAKSYTDTEVKKVQDEVDALETLVGTLPEATDATTVVGYIDAKTANIASDETVGAIDDRVKAIEDDYLVEADKTALQDQITANANAIELLTNGVSADEVDGVNDLINYVKEHGTEVTGMKEDIAANAKAISDHETLAAETYETKTDASAKLTEAKGYTDTAKAAVIGTAEDASSADTVYGAKKYAEEKASAAQTAAEATAAGALATARTEITAEIDADVKALADGAVKDNTDAIAELTQTVADNATAANDAVEELAGNVYTKEQTYTQDEVDAAIEAACSWGSF